VIQSERRAAELLESWLSPDQLTTWKTQGYFDVVSYNGKRTYRMHRFSTPMLLRVELGHRPRFTTTWGRRSVTAGARYCIHMTDVPWDDYTLGIAMMLSSREGEKQFHRIANWPSW
jgi:hypothetical protein